MSESQPEKTPPTDKEIASLFAEMNVRCPFGPAFFAMQLRGLVRDRCPDPAEGLPSVQIHLRDGDCLEVCHIIGFTPQWVALAVWDDGPTKMRTELVPYEMMTRVVIRSCATDGKEIGFDTTRAPAPLADAEMTPEDALRAAGGHAAHAHLR